VPTKKTDRNKADKGFTMIELLIVIIILGVLAATVVFAVQNIDAQSAAASCQTDYKTVETAQEAFHTQVGRPATTISQLYGTTSGIDGTSVGPWLKDSLGNTNRYVIAIDDGTVPGGTAGNITVQTFAPPHSRADGNANCTYA
jgi:general secretion pathway protein G